MDLHVFRQILHHRDRLVEAELEAMTATAD